MAAEISPVSAGICNRKKEEKNFCTGLKNAPFKVIIWSKKVFAKQKCNRIGKLIFSIGLKNLFEKCL
jgi:hypothetical protein